MQPELAGVHRREEIAPHERQQHESAHHDDGEGAEHAPALRQRLLERGHVGGAEPLESPLECVVNATERARAALTVALGREQVAHERGDDRP